MKYADSLFQIIKSGLNGDNLGITTGLPKLDETIAGIQRATMYNVGAGQGVGKSSLALSNFIYQPLLNNPKLKIIYFSLELTGQVLLAKLLSLRLYEVYQVDISYKRLISRTKNTRLTQEEYTMVESCLPWLKDMESRILIYDKALTTSAMYKILKTYSEANGKWLEEENNDVYKSNDPEETILIVLDHIGLMRKLPGQTKKDAIDTACDELIYFRNKCSYSSLILQQLNRTNESMDRRKAELQEPELQDFKDSGGPSEAADVVLAIFFPHRSKMTTYRGFKIAQGFREALRSLIVLKNRYGDVDVVVPVNFFGSIGLFQELDDPKNYENVTDYTPYRHLFPIPVTNMLQDTIHQDPYEFNF